ncbi:MAG: citrate/2-methylcitrate synthase [Coriobacteriia bacterium]|nr:citrate/2-methylcitrate synthase [Coriobacteriia bacterium]
MTVGRPHGRLRLLGEQLAKVLGATPKTARTTEHELEDEIPQDRDALLAVWTEKAERSSFLDPALYEKYDVKRGLRDQNGKGVLAGLTCIGDVVNTPASGDASVPVPGRLLYRGIMITELVDGLAKDDRPGFEETAYLILFGKLPNRAELNAFDTYLSGMRKIPRSFIHDDILRMPSRDIMNAMMRSVLGLYTLDAKADDASIQNVLRQSLHLIAKLPMIAVYAYQAYLEEFSGKSLVIHRPESHYSTAENFLHMLRPDSTFTQLEATVLDRMLVLHAEHGGGNNSSFTTHVVSSTGTDTYSAIAASLGSLKGPRHGGANLKVVQMFDDLKTVVSDWKDDRQITDYLRRVLDKEAFDKSGLIYGLGHPVYTVSDPRATILEGYAEQLALAKGYTEDFELHSRVARIAPLVVAEKHASHKGVCINVDFYSGFVYRMLDIPTELYTPLFAISRIVGWSAHRLEELGNGGKIIRPAYQSVLPAQPYVPIGDR